jgi:hypothetical protein
MSYIDDINNIRKIYVNFCEYLDELPTDIKHIIIEQMTNYGNDILNNRVPVYNVDNPQPFIQHEHVRVKFRSFLTGYVFGNPELRVYKEEIVNIQFNIEHFNEGFEIFNTNDYYLK